mmetsp:Transcript_18390/g.25490  ORF Transcript_18390/g.25490 Transcript_18390/m.25490 type:complete len:222 (-) Transcript_18390:1102-1767(-)
MRQFSARICCIWMVDTSVHLPWRMTSTVDWMDGSLEVKGAATEASPSFTEGTSPDSASAAMADACAAMMLPPAPLGFLALALFFCSAIIIPMDDLAALKAAQLSPSASSRRSSCSYHCFCSSCISAVSFLRSSCACLAFPRASSIAFAIRVCFSCAVSSSSAFSPSLAVLAPPNPLSSATPTSACLSAPTSLAPSPHMRVPMPRSLSARMTRSLSSGAMRA